MTNNTMTELHATPFSHPAFTATGEPRAHIALGTLKTLWFNTGTLCNITCENCYIESSPRNDRLVYLSRAEVDLFLDEIATQHHATEEIGITGGEPFMNPDILLIMQSCLARGFKLLVLTNAMRPMMRPRIQAGLLDLKKQFAEQLTLRVSIDHFDPGLHEQERGPGSWSATIRGMQWLQRNGFAFHIAGRTRWGDSEAGLRQGYARMFDELDIHLDTGDPQSLVLFPEIDVTAEVPEITTACWDILGVNPSDMMCASSRMVVKHKGDNSPSVMACTLLAYESDFNLGRSLADASATVALNHPNCATFCVLGGGSCSA
jgi:uncharacterized Fe-S cluster-containing radical SAM superfamily protein